MIWYRMEHKKHISTNIIKYRPGSNFFRGRKQNVPCMGFGIDCCCYMFTFPARRKTPCPGTGVTSQQQ